MSLESKIEVLTAAILANTAAMQALANAGSVAPQAAQAVVPQQMPPVPAPAQFIQQPAAAPVAPPAGMPGLPNFGVPAQQAPAPAGAPFNDLAGLVKYATAAFAALGPKGEMIGQVMAQLGHDNINNIRPDQYGAFYTAVEALKAS